uniref:Cyclic nucleotide-binding domain-containing protein n=1 Tax=Alexandrium monilatum TaxID=311494 RepID=A0A7S4RRV0_9DINO
MHPMAHSQGHQESMISVGMPVAPAAAKPAAAWPHRPVCSLHLRSDAAAGTSSFQPCTLATGLVAGLGAEASSRRSRGPWGQRFGRTSATARACLEESSAKRLVESIKRNERLIGFCWLMGDEELKRVIRGMRLMDVEKDEVVVRQGEPGDKFYIIEEGFFDIEVDGHKVAENRPGDSFGELALLYSQPRAATVVASRPGRLWVMDQAEFKAAVLEQKVKAMSQKYLNFLRGIPDFQGLSSSQLDQVGRALVPRWYGAGQEMLRVDGDSFEERMYILRTGDAMAVDSAGNKKLVYSQPGDVISKDAVAAVAGDTPVSVCSSNNTTVALCMSTLTLTNILQGRSDPVSVRAESVKELVDQGKQSRPDSEQCVCM